MLLLSLLDQQLLLHLRLSGPVVVVALALRLVEGASTTRRARETTTKVVAPAEAGRTRDLRRHLVAVNRRTRRRYNAINAAATAEGSQA